MSLTCEMGSWINWINKFFRRSGLNHLLCTFNPFVWSWGSRISACRYFQILKFHKPHIPFSMCQSFWIFWVTAQISFNWVEPLMYCCCSTQQYYCLALISRLYWEYCERSCQTLCQNFVKTVHKVFLSFKLVVLTKNHIRLVWH